MRMSRAELLCDCYCCRCRYWSRTQTRISRRIFVSSDILPPSFPHLGRLLIPSLFPPTCLLYQERVLLVCASNNHNNHINNTFASSLLHQAISRHILVTSAF